MSEFEYITVLLSIIFGLAMSHLLRGVGIAIFHRKQGSWDWVHGLWAANTFLLLAVNWWVIFQFQAYADGFAPAAGAPTSFWSVEIFLILLLWAVFLYMPSILLFPPNEDEYEDYNAIFHRNRFFLMGTLVGFGVMDIVQTAARRALFDPPFYLLFVGQYIAVFLLAMFVRRRSVQLFVAWWVFITLVVWTFGVRRLLT